MSVGAIILAAGRSSRMGEFKPLLKLGNQAMIEHVITSFQKISCDEIVVVTGREPNRLMEYVAARCPGQVSYVHNKEYETNEMFDSVKLGLQKITTDRIFITTTDIPLFSFETLEGMLGQSSDIIKPSFRRKSGHPILISSAVKQDILRFHGAGGLKGALQNSGKQVFFYETEDEGILFDADTKEDFAKLQDKYRKND